MPLDLEQSFATIVPYTLEEAYEVADAIERGDMADLRDELGDLLLQVVFHARMAEEQGAFDFGGVVDAITTKLIRRHPHVFGALRGANVEDVKGLWDRIKAEEKAERAARRGPLPADTRALAGVPVAMTALTPRDQASGQGRQGRLRLERPMAVLSKIREECDEIEHEISAGDREESHRRSRRSVVRRWSTWRAHLDADPETTLRGANAKFVRRFGSIERALAARDKRPQDATLAEMDALWDAAKAEEKMPPA